MNGFILSPIKKELSKYYICLFVDGMGNVGIFTI